MFKENKGSKDSIYNILKSNKIFKRFIIGKTVSTLGDATFRMSLFWYVSNTLSSKSLIGIIGFSIFFPAVLMGPITGWLSDKIKSIKILGLLQFTLSFFLLCIPMIGYFKLSPYFILPVTIINAIFSTYSRSFETSFLRSLLGKDEMQNLAQLNSVLLSIASILGPIMVSLPFYFKKVPFEVVFYVNSFSFFIYFLILLTLPNSTMKIPRDKISLKAHFFTTLKEVFLNKVMLKNFIEFMIINFAFGAIAVALPIIVNFEVKLNPGNLYANLELLGSFTSIITSIYLKKLNSFKHYLIVLAILFYFVNYFKLSSLGLYLLIFAVYSTSIIITIDTQTLFMSFKNKEVVGGLRNLLITGKSLAAAISSLIMGWFINYNYITQIFLFTLVIFTLLLVIDIFLLRDSRKYSNTF